MTITKINISILLFFLVSGLSAPVFAEKKQEFVPIGSPLSDSIHFQFALYYLSTPKRNPQKALIKINNDNNLKFTLIKKLPKLPKSMFVKSYLEKNVKKNYAPPSVETLKYSGRGLSKEQADLLQKSQQAFILNFSYPKKYIWTGLKAANNLLVTLAGNEKVLLWDEQTREIFTRDEWVDKRLSAWNSEVPVVSRHFTIHAYKSGEYIRAITLGMLKMGLPDVVIDNFVWSSNKGVSNTINLFTQSMAEGAIFSKSGLFDLEIRSIKDPDVRKSYLESLKDNAKGVAYLTLRKGNWEEGDPANRLIQLMFDRYPGQDVHAKYDAMVSALYGSEDSIKYIKHSNELKQESAKAKAKLPGLSKAFTAGLKPGEFIQVKAPFPVPGGGNEWMWVEITKWNGSKIEGLLKNEPFNIPTLHAGQIVKINQEDVFDYIRRYPDGKEEGNKTGDIIRKMQDVK